MDKWSRRNLKDASVSQAVYLYISQFCATTCSLPPPPDLRRLAGRRREVAPPGPSSLHLLLLRPGPPRIDISAECILLLMRLGYGFCSVQSWRGLLVALGQQDDIYYPLYSSWKRGCNEFGPSEQSQHTFQTLSGSCAFSCCAVAMNK